METHALRADGHLSKHDTPQSGGRPLLTIIWSGTKRNTNFRYIMLTSRIEGNCFRRWTHFLHLPTTTTTTPFYCTRLHQHLYHHLRRVEARRSFVLYLCINRQWKTGLITKALSKWHSFDAIFGFGAFEFIGRWCCHICFGKVKLNDLRALTFRKKYYIFELFLNVGRYFHVCNCVKISADCWNC